MINYKLFAVLAFVLVSGIYFEDAFADTPTANSATVDFDGTTGVATLTWNFGTHDARESCILKTETLQFPLKLANGDDADPSDSSIANSTATTFLGTVTGTVYSGGMYFETILADSNRLTDATVPCTGNLSYTIPDRFIDNDIQLFATFGEIIKTDDVADHSGAYTLLDTIDFDDGANLNTLHEISIQYSDYIRFAPLQCGGDNRWEKGTEYFKDIFHDAVIITLDTKGTCAQNNFGGTTNPDGTYGNSAETKTTEGTCLPTTATHDGFVCVTITTTVYNQAGGDDDSQSKPTFAFDHNTNIKRIDTGLVINGTVFPITHNYHTPFPMLHLEVGATQNFTATVFSPNPLMKMEFAFGIDEVDFLTTAEASIEIETNYDGEVLSSKITRDTDPPVLNATSLESSVSKVKCVADDNSTPCYRVSIEFSFMEAPLGEVFGLQAIDSKRKNQILYFNDGITLEGDSQNPPVTQEIMSEIKYKGLQTVQRIDKENDIWETLDKSEPVLKYQQNEHGTFNPLEYRITESTPDEFRTNPDRLHEDFIKSIKFEQKRAVQYFDSALYLAQLPDSWSHHWKETDRMDEIIDDIVAETKRTQEVYENSYSYYEKTKSNH